MFLAPCMHDLCRMCLLAHQRACAERGGPLLCPMCRAEIQDVMSMEGPEEAFPWVDHGGTLVRVFAGLVVDACETLHWAARATEPSHRPPFDVKVLRLTLEERDGAVGSAKCLVEDGMRLAHLLKTEKPIGAVLFDRRDARGNWQCQNLTCGVFESPEEGRRTSLCTGCRVARFCSRQCQTTAWTMGHKRMCKMWKAYQAAREAADG